MQNRLTIRFISLVAFIVLMGTAAWVTAQERQSFPKEEVERAKKEEQQRSGQKSIAAAAIPPVLGCRGPITQVIDVGDENLRFTSANYFANPGGGEGGGFDRTPVLSTRVSLAQGTCLDAHVSAIIGGRIYGVAPLTMLQVTVTRIPLGSPLHMFGHFERPYGTSNGPAVALEAERDVDMYASNFFQKVGTGPHEVPPGNYRVDVWWAGNGPGGAIGAAFVLKLYLR
jgi:hypothetical protein